MAQAIPIVTRADPTAARQRLTETDITQPLIMASAFYRWLRAQGTLDLEGLTLRGGELSTGAFGEGFVDRRHPHTYLHEIMAGAESPFASGLADASLFAGRGFVPFGSDDPMVRPFVKYPINHHLAQVLERLVAVAAVRVGPVVAEGGTFNGDEPTSPSSVPVWSRFGDSWSTRVTALPFDGGELSASYAAVRSPEQRERAGLDQRKQSIVARVATSSGTTSRYALAEWERTQELDLGHELFAYESLLAEGAVCRSGVTLAARLERTDRPEEERLADPFRTPRPATDLSIIGITRWTTVSGSVAVPLAALRGISAVPFLEVSRLHAAQRPPAGLFDPRQYYGSNDLWMLSAGLRLRVGHRHQRMGRYGAALPAQPMMGMSEHDMAGMHDHPSDVRQCMD